MEVQVNWQLTTEEQYWEMLGVLPPAYQTGDGFLVGEPMDHCVCSLTNVVRPTYSAYIECNKQFYVADRPLTIPEFLNTKRP